MAHTVKPRNGWAEAGGHDTYKTRLWKSNKQKRKKKKTRENKISTSEHLLLFIYKILKPHFLEH